MKINSTGNIDISSNEPVFPEFNIASNTISFDGKLLDVSLVLDKLDHLISEPRKVKIESTINNRSLNIAPVLENIYDRGNVSAVMRSAEAFGFIDFNIIDRADGEFKAANRVTQGADKWLDIKNFESAPSCAQTLKKRGFNIYATHLQASTTIQEIDFTQPTAVVFGNEKDGVSDELLNLCDGSFIIPMYGFSQSFNISVASALTFQFIHQRLNEDKEAHQKYVEKNINRHKALKAWYYIQSINASSQENILQVLAN